MDTKIQTETVKAHSNPPLFNQQYIDYLPSLHFTPVSSLQDPKNIEAALTCTDGRTGIVYDNLQLTEKNCDRDSLIFRVARYIDLFQELEITLYPGEKLKSVSLCSRFKKENTETVYATINEPGNTFQFYTTPVPLCLLPYTDLYIKFEFHKLLFDGPHEVRVQGYSLPLYTKSDFLKINLYSPDHPKILVTDAKELPKPINLEDLDPESKQIHQIRLFHNKVVLDPTTLVSNKKYISIFSEMKFDSVLYIPESDKIGGTTAIACGEGNSVRFTTYHQLSKNNRLQLDRRYCLLGKMEIVTMPSEKIKSVTLWLNYSVPKDEKTYKEYTEGLPITDKHYPYQEEKQVKRYRQLVTLTDVSGEFQFFERPIPMCTLLFSRLSVSVEFERQRADTHYIKLEAYCLNNKDRNSVIKNDMYD